MPNKNGYIYDKELDEYYSPNENECEIRFCENEAVEDNLCEKHWEETQKHYYHA